MLHDGINKTIGLLKPTRSTARPAFERVAERLQVESSMLEYLFNECFNEILTESMQAGACTLRGLGRFRLTTLAQLAKDNHSPLPPDAPVSTVLVFERTRHTVKNTPFAALRLKTRISKKTAGE